MLALLAATMGQGLAAQPAAAADLSLFDAGDIISDAVFFNPRTMSAADVQAFLQQTNPGCRPGSDGTPCLKDYRLTTWNRPADARCPGAYVGAANERASDVIAKVAVACNINPAVLIVTLQKEQSLVTASGSALTPRRYQTAMGFGCPDTAPCDAQYYGLFNQLYKAAWQFQYYAANPTRYKYRAGTTSRILYHPTSSCGTKDVYIRNQATAGLYVYTPYTPNAAALAAGRGTGDSCSSYGNRNFFSFFTDWFVSTRHVVTGAIRAWYQANGESSRLGAPTAAEVSLPGGVWTQRFAGGTATFSPGAGVVPTYAFIDAAYRTEGGAGGKLGAPTRPEESFGSGTWAQRFVGGSVTYTGAAGAVPTFAHIDNAYRTAGGPRGKLGTPSAAEVAHGGGTWSQRFTSGSVTFTGSAGAVPTYAYIDAAYRAAGGAAGKLGAPTAAERSIAGGVWTQPFAGGTITYTGATGAVPTFAFIDAAYRATGGAGGKLGTPTGPEKDLGRGTWSQSFTAGTVTFTAASGAVPTFGAIDALYRSLGGPTGKLGTPTAPESALPGGGWTQPFTGGTVTWTPAGGAIATFAFIDATYRAAGGPTGKLGTPTAAERALAGGAWTQPFTGGTITWTPTSGAVPTFAFIDAAYRAAGGPSGRLGTPTAPEQPQAGGVWTQSFQNGTITFTPGTGTSVTYR